MTETVKFKTSVQRFACALSDTVALQKILKHHAQSRQAKRDLGCLSYDTGELQGAWDQSEDVQPLLGNRTKRASVLSQGDAGGHFTIL